MATVKLVALVLCFTAFSTAQASKFWDDFYVTFGEMNVKYPGTEIGNTVQIGLDNRTGKMKYLEWPYSPPKVDGTNFGKRVKLVGGNSAGTVTSYYMASIYKKWCEVDFEFLGNVSGQPYILQTNVFSEGVGEREQRIYLWFDPTADYHDYGILWNQALILFLVDNRVVRVFYNAKDIGIPYLDYQPMYIYSSIWNGDSWATRGGRDKIDWKQQPFLASYTGFNISNACAVRNTTGYHDIHDCYRILYESAYGQPPNLMLSRNQVDDLRWIQSSYLIYDYCTDLKRFKGVAPPECVRNWP